jgi:pyruvate,water dikinase
MLIPFTLPLDDPVASLEIVGGKGASLSRLLRADLPVPDGFHLTTAAYKEFVSQNDLQARLLSALRDADPAQPSTLETVSQRIWDLFSSSPIPAAVLQALQAAYAGLPGKQPAVAVRSSATAEDLPDLSFAGQQETFLNISGIGALQEAVRCCWASLWTARAIAYRIQHNVDQAAVALAVVVQLLIDAEAAGILFTANPINGKRDEMLINSSWGLGEAVVGGHVTPDTFVASKQTGEIKHIQVASKAVMTVRTVDGTTELAVPEMQRDLATLSAKQVTSLVQLANKIETLYGLPQDIEWCRVKNKFYILQSRPITSLPPAPLDWPRRDPKATYMRGSLVDLLPDPLSPLFESLGIPAIMNGVFNVARTLTPIEPPFTSEYFTSINHYAYMNARLGPGYMKWIFVGMLPAFPRLLRNLIPMWRDELRPAYRQTVEQSSKISIEQQTAGQLWHSIQELVTAAMHYTASLLFATMGASAGAEAVLTGVYKKFVQRPGDPPPATLMMGYDSLPIQSEKSLYDLAQACRQDPALTEALLSMSGNTFTDYLQNGTPDGVDLESWQAFRDQLNLHLSRFGHMIYQLDFAYPLPVNDPSPLLETLKMYLRGAGSDPHARQQRSAALREQTAQQGLSRSRGLKRWIFKKSLGIGQPMSLVREDAIADIGLGYPLLRRMFGELGRRLASAGALPAAEDIYWLLKEEIGAAVAALEAHAALADYAEFIEQRKAEWQALKKIVPPPMIPMKKKYYGFSTDIWITASEDAQTAQRLKGIPASPGKVTAPARVLNGPQDFDQMRPGEVLIAGTTTPAWTPLFAMASAVITDIGGPLSHGSIVAREYGIPAVMGTGVATRRIHSGQVITVDGDLGLVLLDTPAIN